MGDLLHRSLLRGSAYILKRQGQQLLRHAFERQQLSVRDIVAFVFLKPIQKNPPVVPVGRQDSPIPTALPCPWSRHAFFDDAPTKVRIDQPLLHFRNGLTQGMVRKIHLLLPPFKGQNFEDLHAQDRARFETP
jgi:hypothetical protein